MKKFFERFRARSKEHDLRDRVRRSDFFGFGDGDDEDDDRGGNSGKGSGGHGRQGQNLLVLLIAALVTLLFVSYFMGSSSSTTTEITYSQFIKMVNDGEIARVEIQTNSIDIAPKQSGVSDDDARFRYYTGLAESSDALTQRMLDAGIIVSADVPNSTNMIVSVILTYILPILLMWALLSVLFRRMSRSGGMMGGVGKSNAKEYVQRETGVTFADVAGEDEAKESLVEVVDFLHNPQKYTKIGAKLPKGALLVGPPGTGKTLLAKAVAGEAHVPFFSLTGSDFIELYVGVGASRVRDLFREATKNAPCIIFIDEIDAIGRSRDSKYGGGNEEREQTLNQLLSEMDGFDSDLKGRIAILKVHAKNVKMDETVDFNEIALATSGAVGSDLANMINEAAINAVKDHREFVSQKDLFEAVEQVLVGKEKKDRIMSPEERRIVSYHEVGHALISAVQKNAEPVQKITIVPRTMGALGYVMQVPEEEHYLNSKEELHDMIVGLLGGRAAEELKFRSVTTGASNDIERATGIAKAMVTQYGMSERFGIMGLATVESQYLDGRAALNCADATAAAVDEEVRRILEDCYQEAKQILSENLDVMDRIADYLIREETITGRQFMRIYREAKGLPQEDDSTPRDHLAGEEMTAPKPAGKPFPAPVEPAPEPEVPISEVPISEVPISEQKPAEESVQKPAEEPAEKLEEKPAEKPEEKKSEGPVGRFSGIALSDLGEEDSDSKKD